MHVLIAGITGSGKSTLAKFLARDYRQMGLAVLVLDPHRDPQWPASHFAQTPEEFLSIAQQSQRCMLFVDEAGESLGLYDKEMHWCATQARKWGHVAHFVCQRPTQIAPLVRDQCTRLFLFKTSAKDSKAMADEFGTEELLEAKNLDQFEYFDCPSFGTLKRLHLPGPFIPLDTSNIGE